MLWNISMPTLGESAPQNIVVLMIFKVVFLSPITLSFFFSSSLDYKIDCGCQV